MKNRVSRFVDQDSRVKIRSSSRFECHVKICLSRLCAYIERGTVHTEQRVNKMISTSTGGLKVTNSFHEIDRVILTLRVLFGATISALPMCDSERPCIGQAE